MTHNIVGFLNAAWQGANAAGGFIVAEASGRLSDFSGNSFSIWGSENLASNTLIHDETIRVAGATAKIHVDCSPTR